MNGSRPACFEECATFVRKALSEKGIDAMVTHLPPVVASGYEPLDMRCPHGVLWFAEPTSDQIAAWARDGVA